jgi:hypothetical protein
MPVNARYNLAPPPLQEKVAGNSGMFSPWWQRWLLSLMDYHLIRWTDLRFPASGLNPPGAASDPTRSTTTGLLEFSGTADNIIAGVAQMPHEWMRESTVSPHIHLRFPTSAAANTRWQFEYDIANVNGNFTNLSGAYTTLPVITIANPQNVYKHVIDEWDDIPMIGYTESCAILWKITRLAASDGLDTDTNDCELLEFDIHYQSNKTGTVSEIPPP